VRAGPTSFDDLICHLPGVYPTEVRAALGRLHVGSTITDAQLERALRRQPKPALLPLPPTLPVPHPLDFDWRFAPDGVDALVSAGERCAGVNAHVVCVGAPSLHERLVTAGRQSTLLDANEEMVAALSHLGPRSIRTRLGYDPLPAVVGEAVVIDPPWYPEHVELFLWAASFPPAGTRAGVAEERERALSFAATVGLSLVEIRRGELAYRSPPFERIALEAAGLVELPDDWRRGDLLLLSTDGGRPSMVAPPSPVADDVGWLPLAAAPTRIKVRRSRGCRAASAPVRPRLGRIVDGDVLPSVSRRDPRRSRAVVWTACNRVYSCDDPSVLSAIADARARGGDAVAAVAETIGRRLSGAEEREVHEAVEQLDELVRLETDDLQGCGWLPPRP
jgi:hypothetical protein